MTAARAVPTHLVERAIEPAALIAEVAHGGAGALATFFGAVREWNDGRPVTGIEYAAYDELAERELGTVADEARATWPGARIALRHRIGSLRVGEISVGIAVAHAHRAPAFDACRFVIEELKRRVPIWKRELYADGSRAWVAATTKGPALAEVAGVSHPGAR